MTRSEWRSALVRCCPDSFSALLVSMVALASILPVHGHSAVLMDGATNGAIALLFFLHGAKLSPDAVVEGATHWRLHAFVLGTTFVLFPILGLVARPLVSLVLSPSLTLGVLFACLLSSTVQSSIAFTSIGGGNVAAAVCSASASNLLGIIVTPFLASVLISSQGAGVSLDAIGAIIVQLLLPFLAGQAVRRWISAWLTRHRSLVGLVDRGSILMIVYGAFSDAVSHGLWHEVSLTTLATILVVDTVLLSIILMWTTAGSRWLGFAREDEIAIVFCGSKKSLASGVSIASVLFPAASIGLIVLPVMLFHQIQLMICATLARRYARHRPVRTDGTGHPHAAGVVEA